MELSNPEGGAGGAGAMPCPANDRRGSGTSSLSSAYTVSRRSSMVSPYLSSRRSSEVSQMGGGVAGHSQGMMGQEPGSDPLSPEMNRRAVSCQGSGSLPGLPSLTPAQQYNLKAKYAAATGGPPPTPLPNMEQPGTPGRRVGFMSEYHSQPLPPYLQQGTGRRHSANTEYGTGVMYPHQAPGNGTRRASDPVRSGATDPQGLPKVQRFSSLNNVSMMSRRNASVNLPHCGSDANIARHMYSPRPPSITENVMMEALAMEPHGGTGGEAREHSMMMGQGHMGYQQQHHHHGPGSQLSPGTDGMGCPDQAYQSGQAGMQGHYGTQMGQADMANSLLQQAEYGMSTCQLSPSGPTYPSLGQGGGGEGMGGPWGGDGTLMQGGVQFQDQSMQGSHYPQQGMYNNADGCHQKVTIKPEQQFHPSMSTHSACQNAKPLLAQRQLSQPGSMPLSPQAYAQQQQQAAQGVMSRPSNASCDYQGQMEAQQQQQQQQQQGSFPGRGALSLGCTGSTLAEGRRSQTPMLQVKEMMVRNYVQSQQALMWEQQLEQQQKASGGVSDGMDVSGQHGSIMQHSSQQQQQQAHNMYPATNYPAYPNQNLMSPPAAAGTHSRGPSSVTGSCYGQDIVPRPPQGRKPLSRQNSLPQQGGGYLSSPPHLSPSSHSAASPRRAVRLPPVQPQQQQQQQLPDNFPGHNNNNNGPMYYSGQIHMHHDMEKPLSHPSTQPGSCLNQMGAVDPGSKPLGYSESGPISNTLENLDLDNAQIDFTSIIDDQDPSSYSPINPPLGHQSSSQASSRLTTPQTSISQPSGLSNMAVGDMTTMLTSLAGENKYLNTLS